MIDTPITRIAAPTVNLTADVARSARSRTERDQYARLSELLSDRVGFRPLCPRKGYSGHGRGSGVGSLVAYALVSEPRLPAGIRLAVRAVLGFEPPRGARYRHRFLQGSPRRGHSIRQRQIRRGKRRANRHVRHAGGAGGHSRRRPGIGDADSASRCRRGDGARRAEHFARRGIGAKRRFEKGVSNRRRSARTTRSGPQNRGFGTQRRHACRGGGDRRSAADRIRAAVPGAEQRRSHHPMGDGRRRAGRAY